MSTQKDIEDKLIKQWCSNSRVAWSAKSWKHLVEHSCRSQLCAVINAWTMCGCSTSFGAGDMLHMAHVFVSALQRRIFGCLPFPEYASNLSSRSSMILSAVKFLTTVSVRTEKSPAPRAVTHAWQYVQLFERASLCALDSQSRPALGSLFLFVDSFHCDSERFSFGNLSGFWMCSVPVNIYSDEPEGCWHPLTKVHGGGPSWRWAEANCLRSQTKCERAHALLVKYVFPDMICLNSVHE